MHEPTEVKQFELVTINMNYNEARSIDFSAIFGLFWALENSSFFPMFKFCLFSCHHLATFNIEEVIKQVDFAINTNMKSND